MWVAGCVLFLCVDALTKPRVEVLQGGCDMEKPSASKHATADRSDDGRESVRNGIRVDGTWKHQRLRKGTSRRRSARACKFSIKNLVILASLTIA